MAAFSATRTNDELKALILEHAAIFKHGHGSAEHPRSVVFGRSSQDPLKPLHALVILHQPNHGIWMDAPHNSRLAILAKGPAAATERSALEGLLDAVQEIIGRWL